MVFGGGVVVAVVVVVVVGVGVGGVVGGVGVRVVLHVGLSDLQFLRLACLSVLSFSRPCVGLSITAERRHT